MDPILEELIAATLSMTVFAAFLAFLYWAFTGNSPWPHVVIAEVLAFSFGIGIMTLAGPKRRRP